MALLAQIPFQISAITGGSGVTTITGGVVGEAVVQAPEWSWTLPDFSYVSDVSSYFSTIRGNTLFSWATDWMKHHWEKGLSHGFYLSVTRTDSLGESARSLSGTLSLYYVPPNTARHFVTLDGTTQPWVEVDAPYSVGIPGANIPYRDGSHYEGTHGSEQHDVPLKSGGGGSLLHSLDVLPDVTGTFSLEINGNLMETEWDRTTFGVLYAGSKLADQLAASPIGASLLHARVEALAISIDGLSYPALRFHVVAVSGVISSFSTLSGRSGPSLDSISGYAHRVDGSVYGGRAYMSFWPVPAADVDPRALSDETEIASYLASLPIPGSYETLLRPPLVWVPSVYPVRAGPMVTWDRVLDYHPDTPSHVSGLSYGHLSKAVKRLVDEWSAIDTSTVSTSGPLRALLGTLLGHLGPVFASCVGRPLFAIARFPTSAQPFVTRDSMTTASADSSTHLNPAAIYAAFFRIALNAQKTP